MSLAAIVVISCFIALRRSLGCSPDDGWWGALCSYRIAGLAMLLTDAISLWILLWFAAEYDPQSTDHKRPSLRQPRLMLMAAARASGQATTPHRWKHRIGFWAFVLMLLAFVYLVYFAPVASA